MNSRRSTLVLLAVCFSTTILVASDTPTRLNQQARMDLVRGLNAELVFVRRPFPMGPKGLTIKDGKVSPSEEQVQRMIAGYGPAVKPGDRAQITNVRFKGSDIIFEINGGPIKKKKWYEHITVSGMGGSTTPTDPTADNDRANPRGTLVTLAFDKYVPDLSIEQVKQLLRPVLDFNATSAVQAYLDTLPPKVKDAIKNHQVLVGMNREMVTYALGRPPKKYRDHDSDGKDYEEWIYGEPPKDVQFVRFVGEQVVRLEIMKVDGQKIVKTEREVDLKPKPAVAAAQAPGAAEARPANAPTLRRPGEAAPPAEPLPKGGVDDPNQKPPQ